MYTTISLSVHDDKGKRKTHPEADRSCIIMFSLLSLNRNISVCSLRRSLVCQNSPFGKSWTSCPPFHQGSNSSNTTTNSSTEALLQSSRSSTFSSLDLTRRFKHSSTQIKRLFRKHPARLRIEGRQGIDRTNPAVVPLQPLLFPPIFTPVFLSNGWSAPPTSVSLQQQSEFSALETTTTTTTVNTSHNEGILPNYPFRVQRTRNKPNDAIGFLPVYTKHR